MHADGTAVALKDYPTEEPAQGNWQWLHLDRMSALARDWMENRSGIDALAVESALEEDTRPRAAKLTRGTLAILRGINLNAQADDEELLALRIWIEDNRIITLRKHHVLAVSSIREEFEAGKPLRSISELVLEMTDRICDPISGMIAAVEDELDELEEDDDANFKEKRVLLLKIRQRFVPLRRYFAPQRETYIALASNRLSVIEEDQRIVMQEIADRMIHFVEELDELRERASLLHEEFNSKLNEKTNRTIYILSIITAIFLPVTFITGLFGMNVAGLPGTEHGLAFWLVCIAMAAIAASSLGILRWLRWI